MLKCKCCRGALATVLLVCTSRRAPAASVWLWLLFFSHSVGVFTRSSWEADWSGHLSSHHFLRSRIQWLFSQPHPVSYSYYSLSFPINHNSGLFTPESQKVQNFLLCCCQIINPQNPFILQKEKHPQSASTNTCQLSWFNFISLSLWCYFHVAQGSSAMGNEAF